jgi:ribonucleoside-diphosphate reductase alpha chain
MKELIALGLWSDDMKQRIVVQNGSVQAIHEIPEAVRSKYKTSWEIPQKLLIDMAAARGAFLCQSQSLNLFVAEPTISKLTSMHFYAWKKGLKTGCYYLRTKAPVVAQKFTVDPRLLAAVQGSTVGEQEAAGSDTDSDSGDDTPVISVATKVETKAEKLERLAREYDEEVQKNKEALEKGEGCLHCSS